jgi:hypothetical protein
VAGNRHKSKNFHLKSGIHPSNIRTSKPIKDYEQG